MVERTGHGTHTPHLTEIIEFQPSSKAIDTSQIASFYTENRLSAAQIAKKLGCSKSLVITTLKRRGVLRDKATAKTDPTNYRSAPPFGYRVTDGKLTLYPSELKICRLIVELIEQRQMNYRETARYLMEKSLKNRRDEVSWHHDRVRLIYARWKGKL